MTTCIPLTGAARTFLADPSDYVRDGVSFNAVSVHQNNVFPDGPRPFIGGHNVDTSQISLNYLAAAGFTVVGGFYGVHSTAVQANRAKKANLKMIYSFRDHTYPLSSSNVGNRAITAIAGAAGPNSTAMNKVRDTYRQAVDMIKASADADSTVIGWGFTVDDALSVSAGFEGQSRTNYWKFANYMFPEMAKYDQKNRIVIDYPQNDFSYINKSHLENPGAGWQKAVGIWSWQLYWGYDIRGIIKTPKSWINRKILVDYTNRAVQVSNSIGNKVGGKLRLIIPLCWSGGYEDKVFDTNTKAYATAHRRNTNITHAVLPIAGGAHGLYIFQLAATHNQANKMSSEQLARTLCGKIDTVGEWREIVSSLQKHKFFDAALWGTRKTEVKNTRAIVGNYNQKDVYQSINPTWNTSSKTFAHQNEDMLSTQEFQFKGTRFLVVSNMLASRAIRLHTGAFSGQANHPYTLENNFRIPANMVGVKCTEIVNNQNVDIASTRTINCRIGAGETKIYKFEPDVGYCGSTDDDVIVNPVITVEPASKKASIGDDVVFSVTAQPGADAPSNDVLAYQWYWRNPTVNNNTDWKSISGKTARTYSKPNVTAGMSNDEFKCRIVSVTGGSVYSKVAILTIGVVATGQAASVRVANAWKAVEEIKIRTNGAWRSISQLKVRVGTVWKQLSIPDIEVPVPVIISPPKNATVEEGSAPIVLSMDYTPANATVRWQWRNTRLNKPWANIMTNGTNKVYQLTGSEMSLAHDGEEFRAGVTLGAKTVFTAAAKITITAKVNLELVVNGTFSSNTNGWKTTSDGRIERTSDGELKITNYSGDRGYHQARNIVAIPAEKGALYNVNFKLSLHTASSCSFMIMDAEEGNIILDIYGNNANRGKTYSGQVRAATNQLWIRAQVGNGAVGKFTIIDNISIKKV